LELKEVLKARQGQKVDVNLASPPKSMEFIKDKLNGGKLKSIEIHSIIKDVVNNSLSDSEIALFVSAMYRHGMDFKETISLIDAILKTGNELKLRGKYIADKHSIGGVPGNRTTPIVVSICAVAGLTMPKTSSRAITSAAGTADVIEAIAKVEFEVKDLKKIIKKTGAFMVWGGYLGLVPADSKIIRVEKSLKIDPMAQMIASIMSKKLAVSSKYIVIDIPYGRGAKVDKKRALTLKRKFERLGRHFGMKIKCVLTDGSQPIGNGVGPVLELIDIVDILDPRLNGPKDLEDKAIFLSGQLLELTGKAKKAKGALMAREILDSGKAFDKFKQIIAAQEGDLRRLKLAKLKHTLVAKRAGKIKEINNKKITSLARITGCPLDKQCGLYLHVLKNERVKKNQPLITVYSNSKPRLNEAIRFFKEEKPIKLG
jgi:AMP phosphorylase